MAGFAALLREGSFAALLRACWQSIGRGCLLSPCPGIPQLPYRLKSLAAKRRRSFQRLSFLVPAPGPFPAGRGSSTDDNIRVRGSSRSVASKSMPQSPGFEPFASTASFTIHLLPPPLNGMLVRFPRPFGGSQRYGSGLRSSPIRSMHDMERTLVNRIQIS